MAQYHRLARIVAERVPSNLEHNARAFAVFSLALADAFISSFEAKFADHFWRPWTFGGILHAISPNHRQVVSVGIEGACQMESEGSAVTCQRARQGVASDLRTEVCDAQKSRSGRVPLDAGTPDAGAERASAAAAAADDQPDPDRVQFRGRSLDRRARGRRRPPAHQRRRRRDRAVFLAGRNAGRVQRRVRWQPGRLRRSHRRRRAEAADLSPERRHGARLDAGRSKRHLHLDARQLLPLRRPAVHRAVDRRVRGAGPAADRRGRVVLGRCVAPRICAASALATGVETVSRRPDDADLDREPGGFGDRSDPAGELQRLQPDVGRQHDLFPVGSQRSGEPVRVRHDHQAGRRSGQERRARLQVRLGGTRRDRDRAVRRAQAVRHQYARGPHAEREPGWRFSRAADPVRESRSEAHQEFRRVAVRRP
jgi:hypothetical protein